VKDMQVVMAQCEQLSSVETGEGTEKKKPVSTANLWATIWTWGLPDEVRVLPIQPWRKYSIISNTKHTFHYLVILLWRLWSIKWDMESLLWM